MKLLFIFGTRPCAIKMAPVINRLQKNPNFTIKIIVTAQHREMLDPVLNLFHLTPDYDLNLMESNQSLTRFTKSLIERLEPIYESEKPDYVIVQGDTATAFVASLAAYYQQIPIAHIEAGLRTGNLYSPWPEEGFRKMIDAITNVFFTPTLSASQNLINEGGIADKILCTGNTVIDALLDVKHVLLHHPSLQETFAQTFSFIDTSKKILLVTGHRRESFGFGFEQICFALKNLAASRQDIQIIYPIHLNPKVREPVKHYLDNQENIVLIEPVEYLPFVYLMMQSYLILTDSGGIQEEAPSLGIPLLVMRDHTERPEGIKAGTALLTGTSAADIIEKTQQLLDDKTLYHQMKQAHNPYGDGSASAKIEAFFIESLNN